MSIALERVQEALQGNWFKPREGIRGVIVPTTCLYPSGAWVMINVVSGDRSASIHDDGGALSEVAGDGISVKSPAKVFKTIAKKYGVEVTDTGVIKADTSIDFIAPMISLIANASREAAQTLYNQNKPARANLIREKIKDFLDQHYKGHISHNQRLSGASHKLHKFDHLITLSEGRKIVIDFTTPDANSVNGRIVAHMDLKRANHQGLEQKILYDDSENWDQSQLGLLSISASTIPFERVLEAETI